jgi:predicted nucleic acid-binding protein
VVSGDNHLLKLQTFRGISILIAREFVERLSDQN